VVTEWTRDVNKVELVSNSLSTSCIPGKLRRIAMFVKCCILITAKEARPSAILGCERVQNFL
jgi:hypothetical protein